MRVTILICNFNHWVDIHLPSRINVGDCIWLDEVLPKSDTEMLIEKNAKRFNDEVTDNPIYEVVSVDWRKDGDGIYQCAYIDMKK